MSTLTVGIGSMADARARFLEAAAGAVAGRASAAEPAIYFASYDEMHRVLAPARLAIVKAMAGQGPLAIREVARRVGRDVQAVHRDVVTLSDAGIVDRSEAGVTFPHDRIHFEFDVGAAA